MNNSMSCSAGRWCMRADALLGVEGVYVRSVKATGTGLVLGVETGEEVAGCPDCGVVAVRHARRQIRLHDIPCFGRPVRLLWAKRVWRCPDPDCPRTTFSEEHPLAGPRAKLTARALAWATDALQCFDTSVSALADQLGVSWHTQPGTRSRPKPPAAIAAGGRLTGVNALGVDEHVWSHTGPPGSGMVTGIVDHTRDAHGLVHARLLDLVPGRSGKAYADWLKDRGAGFTAGIKTAALDPFRGYANAIRDELPEAITVLDAFHVVKLGSAMVDEVRRRVQQDTLGHRGRKGDPLYGIRRTLQIGAEHLSDKQSARLDAKLTLGDPDHDVTLAWQCYQKLRNIYHARPERGRDLVNEVIASFPTCPIPEVARLGRTLKQWKSAILAYFDTDGASDGAHRSDQRRHRNHTSHRQRLPKLHQLPTQMPTGRWRPPALPNQANQPCLNAKGP
ncbi:ISL3 family transposase [Arthrobacter liuii]|uniref:ISL3 family transposase n=1 Tax=Arthrobacter liuii TaxID=1476996 RepID=A0ABQ2B2L7_9MICC|nr:ISL3 family transposase [Arthrobacter liuii]